jgi:hypothetical protein
MPAAAHSETPDTSGVSLVVSLGWRGPMPLVVLTRGGTADVNSVQWLVDYVNSLRGSTTVGEPSPSP